MWRRDPRGWRRQRWDELDLPRLAELIASLPEDQRAGAYRRLGDGALFLAGVFPEYAERTFGGAGLTRLTTLAGPREGPVTELLEALAGRAYARAGTAVPPGVVESPHTARRVLALVADRHLHPREAGGPPGAVGR